MGFVDGSNTVKDAWHVLKKPLSSLSFSREGCNMNGFCMSRIYKIYITTELEKYGTNVNHRRFSLLRSYAGQDNASKAKEASKRMQYCTWDINM